MSWRDARARVNSGFYKPKEESPLATGFAAAADIVAKSWMQDAADEKEAEKDRLKEEKAERKRIREEQREKEKKDQENRNTAKAAIAQAQLPSSPEIFQQAFVMAQGGADQSKIYDYFISGINKGDIELVGPEQGPGLPMAQENILTALESGPGGANALLNQSQNSQFSDINVSTMPIGKVMAFQQKRGPGSYHAWSKENMPDGTEAKEQGLGSTPVGKYQFIGDTLKDLKENGTLESLGITDDTIFDEKTQDALFVRYAQDRLKGKTTDEERIAEMRNIWEGLKKASDEQVLSVIEGVETGTFDGGSAIPDRNAPIKPGTKLNLHFGRTSASGKKFREDLYEIKDGVLKLKPGVDPETAKYPQQDFNHKVVVDDNGIITFTVNREKTTVDTNDPNFNTVEKVERFIKEKLGDRYSQYTINIGEPIQATGEDRSMMKGETAIFNTPGREFDPVDISSITDFEGWSATNANIKANKLDVDPEFMTFFNERGENLQALQKTEKVEELFSMEVLLADDMTASKLQDRIDLAEAKGMEIPDNIATDILPIIEARKEYSQKELIEMSSDQRALVAKFSTDPTVRSAAARINQGDVNTYSWISEASSSADAMTAKSREFFQAGDLVNFNLATTMAKSIRNGEASYKDLLEPTYLVGKSAQELNAIRRIAEQANAPASELTALKGEIAAAEALEQSGLYRKYADNATSVNTTETQISLAKKEGAGNNIIQALEDLKAQQQANSERQTAAEKNGFNIVTVEAKVPLGDGKFEYKTVYQKPGETGYRDAEGNEVTNALPLGSNENDSFKTIRTETQKIITELGVANTALAEGMNTASQAIEIVEEDARVAGAGGKLAKFLASAGRSGGQVLSVAEELFKSNEEITLDQLQREGGFDNNFLDAVISGNVQNLADATARFEAKMLSLAFQVGRMEGQSGNAMSNQDFRKIMEIVRTSGGSAEAFKKNLTDYMAGKIESYDQKHFKVVGPGSQIQGFKDNYGFSPVSEPLNMADYVAAQPSQSLKDNYKRFTGTQTQRPPRPDSLEGLPRPTSREERDALSNTWYVTPDGTLAWKGE